MGQVLLVVVGLVWLVFPFLIYQRLTYIHRELHEANQRLQVLTEQGQYIATLGSEASGRRPN